MALTSTYIKEWYSDDQDNVETRYTKVEARHGSARIQCNSPQEPTLNQLEMKLNRFFPTWRNYNVMSTDYSSYAVVHSCREYMKFYKEEFVWVLTREILNPIEDEDEYNKIMTIVEDVLVKNMPEYDFRRELLPILQGLD